MAEENFVHKTLDGLLKVIEVELKLPLGIAEVKMSPTAIAKEWRENEEKRHELENAIQRAEGKFIKNNNDNKIARMLHEFPLYSEEEFKKVIAGLLTHLSEEKITWLAEVKLIKTWGNITSAEEIRKALELYLPYLRHELSTIEEFRDAVSALRLERIEEGVRQIDKRTGKIDKTTERIEGKLDEALKASQPKLVSLRTGWFYGHRYGDLAAFTGRTDELKMLDEWLANKTESLLIVNAFGGFGKSALTWHWFNTNVDQATWQTAIWWSFYEKESGFDSFLLEALTHLGMETKERSARQQVNDLLDVMQKTNILIVMDGFERLLRQYARMDAALQDDEEDAEIDPSQRDCTYQSAEIFLRGLSDKKIISKVLMTSRLLPRVLEGKDGKLQKGCREVNLKGFSPTDAVTYFHNEGVQATRAEIVEVCSKYDYHPLSLSLLVGLINEDHEHRGDIAAVKNLEIFDDVKARRHHVLERAYESLAPERRDLLSKISCFRGSMEYGVLKKVFPSPDLDKALLDLRKRGLLQYAGESQRYDMHPIVRHYAYDHFTDEKRRKEAHVQLAMHFVDAMPVTNAKVKTLEDLAPVIELYHHMVKAGNLDEAQRLFHDRISTPTFYHFSAYQLRIELLRALFLDGEDKPPRLKNVDTQAATLNTLAGSYFMIGQSRRVVPLMDMQNSIQEKRGSKKNLAIGLGNVAKQQLVIGSLSEAERNLRRKIDLCREIADEANQAIGHEDLGRVLFYCGNLKAAQQELNLALSVYEKHNDFQGQSVLWSIRASHFLLIEREEAIFDTRKPNNEYQTSAIDCAQRALELAEGGDPNIGGAVVPRDLIHSRWLLGSAYHTNNELTLAEENLSKALNLCRQINNVEIEANILLDLARLRYSQKNYEEAKSLADEALLITERCGYVLQGADVNLFLAELTLTLDPSPEGRGKARAYAEEALKLATCDGPPYYYKVAYEEAEMFLEKL